MPHAMAIEGQVHDELARSRTVKRSGRTGNHDRSQHPDLDAVAAHGRERLPVGLDA